MILSLICIGIISLLLVTVSASVPVWEVVYCVALVLLVAQLGALTSTSGSKSLDSVQTEPQTPVASCTKPLQELPRPLGTSESKLTF